MSEPIRVLITGAAGQIGYSLVLQIAKGDVFGPTRVSAYSVSPANFQSVNFNPDKMNRIMRQEISGHED